MAKKQKPCKGQTTLWTDPTYDEVNVMIDSSRWSGPMTGVLDLVSPRFRFFTIKPDQWWAVLSDLVKISGHSSAASAARMLEGTNYVKRVDEVFPLTIPQGYSLQLRCDQLLVSRHGAYELFIRSDKPNIRPLKERLYELIDQSLGVGGKTLMTDAARKEQARLGSTEAFAIERSELRQLNRDFVNSLPANHAAIYNGRWVGLTNQTSGYWRRQVGDAPLDSCSELTASLHKTATYIVETQVRLCEEKGEPIAVKEIHRLIREVAERLRVDCLNTFGAGADFGVTIEKRRGKMTPIVDVVRQPLVLDDDEAP